MPEAYIVDARRTAAGKRKGALASMHSADLAAVAVKAVLDNTRVDPGAVDDVVLGCIDNIGGQAGNIARTAALLAGLPEHVPGVTVDRQCGSSQQAVHFAAQAVMSGTSDLIVAGGVQNMSTYPNTSAYAAGELYGHDNPWTTSPGWVERYGSLPVSQFKAAESIAEKWSITREEMERFALESHRRAVQAIDEGRFEGEIVPVGDFRVDEGPRRDTSLEKLAGLKTILEDGVLTAGVSSQISDGSSAVLIASERALKDHGLTPRARIHHLSVRGADPILMLTAPIPATHYALQRAGMTIGDIDVVEINEAFASVVLAWLHEFDIDHEKVNPNGGGIALGHPLGATGTKLMSTLLNELERTGGRYGLQTMCEGGGVANVTIIERL